MIPATQMLIELHHPVWKRSRPSQIGRYNFFLAMYQALAGHKGAWLSTIRALQFGTPVIRKKALLLLATLCLPLVLRHWLFVWRSSGRVE